MIGLDKWDYIRTEDLELCMQVLMHAKKNVKEMDDKDAVPEATPGAKSTT